MAFGIYLGRVKRWNSWTVIEDPHTLVEALRAAPSEPARLMLAIIATVGFGLAFSIVYRLLAGPAAAARRLEAVPARRGAES